MLDYLLEIFERDKKSSTKRPGWPARPSGLGAGRGARRRSPRTTNAAYDDRERRHDDDDRDDDDRSSTRKKKREIDFLDFGD